ncbi:MAG: cobalamin B12-binding domain-containing protein [Gemmatimonadetes bacterium]|nr:cobalamin B12-binding domain-containing protein [Gemmatimonadota bacterium]
MRVTLIQPPQGTRFGFTKILMVEPLGLECVSAALRLHEHETHLVDLRLDRPSALAVHLRRSRPAAVGISCAFTTDVYTTLRTAKLVKETLRDVPVFVGGHHASLIPGDFLFPGSPVDAVVIGEGEWPALDLADALERGDDPGTVPGVLTLWNRENGFQQRTLSANLDGLPLPDRELSRRYRRRYHHGFACPSACVETTRGCPFDCNFCSIWVFYQRRARRRSPERIVEDLERVRALGEDHVFFTDDIAFLQRDAYEVLGEQIRAAGLKLHYSCETRADLVVKYRDLFQMWKEIGMNTIFLGIEKVDDAGLDSVRKRTKGGAMTNVEAIEILRSCGITPMTSLITDPAWGEGDFDRLEEFVQLLKLPNPTFTVLTPLPGTELWETVKSQITTDDYNYFDVMHLLLPSKLPPERFYERFARLYTLADVRAQLGWHAAWTLVKMAVRRQGFVVRRVYGAVREMRDPKAYLKYPGSTPKPEFVPSGFGRVRWVDRSRSHLSERVALAVGGA